MLKINTERIYSLLGIYFAFLGVLTLINVAAGYHETGIFLWRGGAYTLINFLMAYGLYTREKWVFPAAGLNMCALVALTASVIVRYGPEELTLGSFVGLILAASVFGYIHTTRKTLRSSRSGVYTGSVFIILWLSTYIYTVLKALT